LVFFYINYLYYILVNINYCYNFTVTIVIIYNFYLYYISAIFSIYIFEKNAKIWDFILLSIPIEPCGEVPKIQPNKLILRIEIVATTTFGITNFLLCCYDREMYLGWKELFIWLKCRIWARTNTNGNTNNSKTEQEQLKSDSL
jgi:hypothetical protein